MGTTRGPFLVKSLDASKEGDSGGCGGGTRPPAEFVGGQWHAKRAGGTP